ncbi:MAG: bleomycin resistance family protein [Solirubrobacteraceae bacterium]
MTHTDQNLELILFGWVDALRRRDPDHIADRLAEDIIWQGLRRDLVCPNREAVLHNILDGGRHREQLTGIELAALDDQHVLLGVQLPGVTEFFGETLDGAIFDVFTIDNGVITRIDEFKTREAALTYAGDTAPTAEPGQRKRAPHAPARRRPRVERVVPILNVSDIHESFAWFEKLGWRKGFEWKAEPSNDAPGFGSVETANCEIFLCRDGQGSRGRGTNQRTFGPDGDETADKGTWMSILVDDVDAIHERCVSEGLDITHPPTNEPWGVRECHVRHPDGHVFRISQSL